MIWTPLHLMILLHYHTVAAPYACHDPEHANSEAVGDYKLHLEEAGLLELTGGFYEGKGYKEISDTREWSTTEKGEVFIEHLLNTPLPVERMTWRVPPHE